MTNQSLNDDQTDRRSQKALPRQASLRIACTSSTMIRARARIRTTEVSSTARRYGWDCAKCRKSLLFCSTLIEWPRHVRNVTNGTARDSTGNYLQQRQLLVRYANVLSVYLGTVPENQSRSAQARAREFCNLRDSRRRSFAIVRGGIE